MKRHFFIKSILCLFLLFGVFNKAKSHSVQVAYCVDCAGNLRIFVEHWHANAAANTTSMTITLVVGTVTTTQTQSPLNNLQNVTLANLPGCSTPIISVAGCTGQMNTYNDWVYFDYTGLPTGTPIQFTIISGSNVFTQDGCNMYPLTVTFTIPPPVTSNTPISLCTGALTPSIGVPAGVSWSNTNPGIGLPASGTGSIAPFIAQGPATGVITYSNGCGIQNMTITTTPALTLTPASNAPFCAGNTLNLTTNAATSYTWLGPNSFTSNVQNPSITGATSLATGAYTVIGSSATGCTASAITNVVVNPLPTPTITSNSPVCLNFPMNFSGSGGVSYSWSGPGLSSTMQNPTIPNASMSNNGNYVLTVTDANGCVNSTNQNFVVNPQPMASVSGNTVCQSLNTFLSAGGGVSYNWTGPVGFSSINQSPAITNAQLNNSGQYQVIITDANTCSDTLTANLIVNPTPAPQIVTNSPICIDHALSLNGSGGVSYFWSGPNGFFSAVQSPSLIANTVGYTGTYNLTVTDINGCINSTSANVIVHPIPDISITSTKDYGCPPFCSDFSFVSSHPIQSYNWSLGNGYTGTLTSTQGCYNATGIYTVNAEVMSIYGCLNSTTHTIEVYPVPVADFNHSPIKPIINIDGEVSFTDASYNANITEWNWYFMNTAQYTSVEQNPTFMYTEPGNYVVALVVKSDKGCLDTVLRPLVVGEDYGIYVPNAFTPNEDGLNDIFQPKGFGIVEYELNIFDRWGEKVFHTKAFEEGWNGSFQGRGTKGCEESSYTWIINLTNVFGKAYELTGHVILIR